MLSEYKVLIATGGQSNTAIEVGRGHKYVHLIPLAESGLRVENVSFEEASRAWKEMPDYPVHRAAYIYVRSADRFGGTNSSIQHLKEILMEFVLSKAGGVLANGNKKEVKAFFSKLEENVRLNGGAFIIKEAEDLKALSLSALAAAYNSLAESPVKKFSDKEKAVGKTFEALQAKFEPKKAPKAGKAPAADNGEVTAPRENSKMGRLVAKLNEGGKYDLATLAKASGYDEQNTRTAVGILRSRKSMAITYDRETKLYHLD